MTGKVDYNIVSLYDDFLNSIRILLNSHDPKSRVTERTDTFTGDGTTTKFLLDIKLLSYVSEVTIDGVTQTNVDDYTIHWREDDIGKVEILTPPADGTTISITWGKINTGESNWIYSDFPRTDIKESTQPRIGFEITDSVGFAGASGGTGYALQHELLIQFKIVGRNMYEVLFLESKIHSMLTTQAKNFRYFRFIQPSSLSGADNFSDNTKQSYSKFINFEANQKYELITYA